MHPQCIKHNCLQLIKNSYFKKQYINQSVNSDTNKCGYIILHDYYLDVYENQSSNIINSAIDNSNEIDLSIICAIAIQFNDLDLFCRLVDYGFDINKSIVFDGEFGYFLRTPLVYAIKKNKIEIVRKIIENYDIGLTNNIHHMAIVDENGCYFSNGSCLPNGVSFLSNDGYSLAMSVCHSESIAMFNYMINYVTDKHIGYITEELSWVQCNYNNEKMDILFNKGINFQMKCDNGNTLNNNITSHCDCFDVNTAKKLIEHGWTPNQYALQILIGCRNYEMLDFLIGSGIYPNEETIKYGFNKNDPNTTKIFIKYNINSDVAVK